MQNKGLALALMLLVFSAGLVGFKGDHHQVSDLQIETVSLERLRSDSRLNAGKITVKSEKHVVTLGGTVATPEEKHLAERIVGSTIVGVSRIINTIQVTSPPVPDAKLVCQVNAELKKSPGLKGATIKAEVNTGIVRLTGEVLRANQQVLARQVAASVPGVVDVVSSLRFVDEMVSDEVTAKEVNTYLEWSPLVHPEQFTVTVKGGVVRIKGQVEHLVHLRTLVEDIRNLRGVRAVESEIEVKG